MRTFDSRVAALIVAQVNDLTATSERTGTNPGTLDYGDGTFDTAVDDEGNVEVGDFGSIDGGDAV